MTSVGQNRHMSESRARWLGALFIFACLATTGILYGYHARLGALRSFLTQQRLLSKATLAKAIGDPGTFQRFPTEVDLSIAGAPAKVIFQYAFDSKLQESME